MHRGMFTTGFLILALLIAFGCSSDEDCPTCPSGGVDTVTQTVTDTVTIGGTDTLTLTDTLTDTINIAQDYPAFIDAYIQDECGNGYFKAEVYSNVAGLPDVDSFQVGDSVCYNISTDSYWDEGDVFRVLFLRDYDPIFIRGQEATVTIWGENRSATATVSVLNSCSDYPIFMVPDGGDTVEVVQSHVVCEWGLRVHAEWYGIQKRYFRDSSGTKVYRDKYTYTYDTTHTVLDTAFGEAVDSVKMWVLPTNGPDPSSTTSNWVGDFATGKLYGPGVSGLANIHFTQPSVVAKPTVENDTLPTGGTAREIISGIREAYK